MRDRRPNTFAATPIRKRPSLDFSVAGLVYSSMMMFMGLAALNSQANLLFGVFGLMIGVLLFSLWYSRVVLRKLKVRRVQPEAIIVGRPCTLVYEVTNRKRFWPSMSVTLSEVDGGEAFERQPHAYMLHAAAKMTALISAEVVPVRRGTFQLGQFQLLTSFPFGFVKRALDQSQDETLLVYPAIGRVDPKLMHLLRSAESSGMTMRPRPGGDDEFYGVKEYRQGENPRRIYWRRSARGGTLVAKEMTHVSPPRILLVVDTTLGHDEAGRRGLLERSIAIAASIADAALEGGLPLGLFAPLGGEEYLRIVPSRGKRQRRDVLTALARLTYLEGHSRADLLAAVRPMVDKATTVVLCTPHGDSSRGGVVVVGADPSSRQYVTFDDAVRFDVDAAEPTESEAARV